VGPGAVVADRFQCLALAGAGGMGSVYRALDRETGATVALKLLHDDASAAALRERFLREAELLFALRHPAIVRYIAHGVADSRPFLALEWLDGEDLAARLGRGPLSVAETLALARRVADALAAAHARGVVHRDIKPSNLFLRGGAVGEVVVLDFGIARLGGGLRPSTRTGVIMGTPGYMAPEQTRGERDLDARADVFSLGCVLHECLTGRPPFVGDHVMAVLAKILLEEVPRVSEQVPDVPPALDDLVARMTAKPAADRPADGAALARELDALAHAVAASPPSRPRLPALTGHERRLLAVLIAGAPDDGASMATAPTLGPTDTQETDQLVAAVRPFGARLDRFGGGAALVALEARGSATDLAARAARCALALRPLLPRAAIAVATGKAVVTGDVPIGEVIDRAATMLGHLGGGGPAPGAIFLDETTAGLLDARFDIGGEPSGLVLRGEREPAETPRLLLGRPTPVVGRDRELAALEAIYAECAAEPSAQVVLVTAPAGLGKSRLRTELLRRLRERDEPPEVWIARGDPMATGVPLGLLGQVVRRTLGQVPGEPLELRRQKLRARVGRHTLGDELPRVVEFLGELAGTPFPDDDSVQLRAARADAALMSDQMLRAWLRWLGAECRERPLVLVLEDLHWGDAVTVKFVDAALRTLAEQPFMVLALARPEVRDVFPSLWSGRGLQEIQLRELARKPAERLVRKVLGDDAPDAVVARLVERAGGNAFYLEELIRAAAERRDDTMPETVLAMVQSRLESLPEERRRVLRAASVFGDAFFEPAVAELLGARAGAVLPSALALLAEEEYVARRAESKLPGVAEYVFRHDLVRQAAYGALTDADRALGHRLAAGWLARHAAAPPAVIADHLRLGRAGAEAAAWYARAAEAALVASDHAGALAYAARGIEAGADGGELARLRAAQAEAHYWRSEYVDAERHALAGLEILEPHTAGWYALAYHLSQASGMLSHHEALGRLARQLGPAPAPVPDGWLRAAAGTAVYLYFAGLNAEGAALLARLEQAVAATTPGPLAEAKLHAARSIAALLAGRRHDSFLGEQRAAEAYRSAGNHAGALEHEGNVAYMYILFGDYRRAEEELRRVVSGCDAAGLTGVAAGAKQNLVMTLARLGRFDEAIAVADEALPALQTSGNARLETFARIYRAIAFEEHGQPARAEAEARTAMTIAGAVSSVLGYAHAVLARAMLAQARADEALAEAERGMAMLAHVGHLEEGEEYLRLVHAEALFAAGREAEARAALAAAHTRVLAGAERIPDPALRATFLEGVPEHARILALTRRATGPG
jgi:hypothetical protein